jgi:2-C-methyl-D-erythritol 4-phosphate cytidylyltransferase
MSWRAHAIVVAAGEGLRVGGDRPKQFLGVGGRPLLSYSLVAFETHPRITGITLVLPAGQLAEGNRIRQDYGVSKLHPAVTGGARRRDSVRAGLEAIATSEEGSSDLLVAIHDGARPVLHLDLLDRLLEDAAEYGAAVPVLPVRDTTVEVAGEDTLGDIVDRRTLRAVQTPQIFRFDWLWEAHKRYGEEDATDDASMVRAAGHPVRLVPGDVMNVKVTDPGDLELVTRILAGEVSER